MKKYKDFKNSFLQSSNFLSSGFTMIEILTVIGVLSILASVVLMSTFATLERTRVTKAKAEVNQIMKAALLIENEYGYLPNDSHGSIFCPKDILIDQSQDLYWGEYIQLCLDPWGNPYEWNNKCTNGEIGKYDNSNSPGCPANSDINQGLYGVTIVGSDGVNDNCADDDICFGENGHSSYGWNSVQNQAEDDDPPPPVEEYPCVNQTSSCLELPVISCNSRQGCFVEAEGCSGTFSSSCSPYGDQNSCQSNSGCSWDTFSSCSGTPFACSSYNSNQTSCQGVGCSWANANYGGTYACSQWNGTNASTCTTGHPGCTWTSSGGGKCNGGSQMCTSFSQSTCTPVGCAWNTSSCTGSPNACSTQGTEPMCSGVGCTWNTTSSCSGTQNSSCSIYSSNQNNCQETSGCTWNSSFCGGDALSCTELSSELACTYAPGCAWQ